jgi:hypothetical protein
LALFVLNLAAGSERVILVATITDVKVSATRQAVLTITTKQVIVPSTTIQGVVAIPAVNVIVPSTTTNGVGAILTKKIVIPSTARDGVFIVTAKDSIVPSTSRDEVVALITVDYVVAGPAVNDVFASGAADQIITASTKDLKVIISREIDDVPKSPGWGARNVWTVAIQDTVGTSPRRITRNSVGAVFRCRTRQGPRLIKAHGLRRIHRSAKNHKRNYTYYCQPEGTSQLPHLGLLS